MGLALFFLGLGSGPRTCRCFCCSTCREGKEIVPFAIVIGHMFALGVHRNTSIYFTLEIGQQNPVNSTASNTIQILKSNTVQFSGPEMIDPPFLT